MAVQFPFPAQLPSLSGSAQRFKSPAVLKRFDAEKASGTRQKLKYMNVATRSMRANAQAKVRSANNSAFNNQAVHFSPAGTWIVTFGTVLGETINGWATRSLAGNAALVTGLLAMVVTAGQTVIIYFRSTGQTALGQTREGQLKDLEEIFGQQDFVNESSRMAKECLKDTDQADLLNQYAQFSTYMTTLNPEFVPNGLGPAWGEVGAILKRPLDASGQKQLTDLIETTIFPLNDHYTDSLWAKLIAMGVKPPKDPQQGQPPGQAGIPQQAQQLGQAGFSAPAQPPVQAVVDQQPLPAGQPSQGSRSEQTILLQLQSGEQVAVILRLLPVAEGGDPTPQQSGEQAASLQSQSSISAEVPQSGKGKEAVAEQRQGELEEVVIVEGEGN